MVEKSLGLKSIAVVRWVTLDTFVEVTALSPIEVRIYAIRQLHMLG